MHNTDLSGYKYWKIFMNYCLSFSLPIQVFVEHIMANATCFLSVNRVFFSPDFLCSRVVFPVSLLLLLFYFVVIFFRDVRLRRGEVCKRQNMDVAHGGTDKSHEP